MIMIILCHFFQYYGNELAWWFNVGVQVFFVISGFLYGRKEIESPIDFIKKQFAKILIPYYAFLLPVIVLYLIFASDHITIVSIVKAIFCAGTIDGIGHLWYVGYILFCYMITPYLYWMKKHTYRYSTLKFVLSWLTLLGLYVISGTLFDSFFLPARVCCYIIGYFIAICYDKFGTSVERPITIVTVSVAFLTNVLRAYLKYFYVMPSGTLFSKVFGFSESYAHLLFGTALFLGMKLLFKKVSKTVITTWSDKYSYHVYIVHQLFILSPFTLMSITSIPAVNITLVFMAIIASAYALNFLSKKVSKILIRSSAI